jgi:hypothetical protein
MSRLAGGWEAETNESRQQQQQPKTMTSINHSKTGQGTCQQSVELENPMMIASTRTMKCMGSQVVYVLPTEAEAEDNHITHRSSIS